LRGFGKDEGRGKRDEEGKDIGRQHLFFILHSSSFILRAYP
jgi:hypothetical protein